MSDNEQCKIFARNLRYYINLSGMNQKEFANAVDVGYTSLNNWCLGKNMPGMGTIQKIADYLGIGKSDLVDEHSNSTTEPAYYHDKKVRELAQFMYENPEYKVLFDASRKVKKEDIEFVKQMIDRVRGDNNDTGC